MVMCVMNSEMVGNWKRDVVMSLADQMGGLAGV